MKSRFIRILAFILGVFLTISLLRSIIDIWQKGGLLDKEEERLAKARLENEELTKEFERLQSPEYIEKQAREKLGLGKENEVVVVLPDEKTIKSFVPKIDTSGDEVVNLPNWRKWFLFFNF